MWSLVSTVWSALVLCGFANSFPCSQSYHHDVVIYGGTSGGYAAAIQLARLNRTVALIEPSSHVGGIAVDGFGASDIDSQVTDIPL